MPSNQGIQATSRGTRLTHHVGRTGNAMEWRRILILALFGLACSSTGCRTAPDAVNKPWPLWQLLPQLKPRQTPQQVLAILGEPDAQSSAAQVYPWARYEIALSHKVLVYSRGLEFGKPYNEDKVLKDVAGEPDCPYAVLVNFDPHLGMKYVTIRYGK